MHAVECWQPLTKGRLRVMRQAKQVLLDEMQHCMTKSKTDKANVSPRQNVDLNSTKSQGSNAMAESTDASPKSTQKEDTEEGATHDTPRKVLRTCTTEEG